MCLIERNKFPWANSFVPAFLSLPVPELASRPLPEYCGLSPGGLANGLLGQDYQGHSFWDTESWMFPALLLLQPRTARALLDYRLNRSQQRCQRFSTKKTVLHRLDQARDYAAATGWSGARFPWESAFTGGEVLFLDLRGISFLLRRTFIFFHEIDGYFFIKAIKVYPSPF